MTRVHEAQEGRLWKRAAGLRAFETSEEGGREKGCNDRDIQETKSSSYLIKCNYYTN